MPLYSISVLFSAVLFRRPNGQRGENGAEGCSGMEQVGGGGGDAAARRGPARP
eukprot:COSAG02_NODE_20636_length_821_cov_1.829640_1_plen_52_part_01